MHHLFEELRVGVRETLSDDILSTHRLIGATDALRAIHFPKNLKELEQAQQEYVRQMRLAARAELARQHSEEEN